MQGITITLTADDKLTNLLERFINALETPKQMQIQTAEALEAQDTLVLDTPKVDEPKMETAVDNSIQEAYESLLESAQEIKKGEEKVKTVTKLTLTEVRKVVIDTGLSKKPNLLSSALNKFGACKLSEVKAEDYKDFVAYVQEVSKL